MFPNQTRMSEHLPNSGGTGSVCADGLRCLACAMQCSNGLSHIKVDAAARIANKALDLALARADRLSKACPHERLALCFRDSTTRDALGIVEDDLFRHGYSVDLLRMD